MSLTWLVLFAFGTTVVSGLAWYALKLISELEAQKTSQSLKFAQVRDSILILIGSYLNDQVDRSECLLRIRVLLDTNFNNWPQSNLPHFKEVSDAILAMPFGKARQKLDENTRRAHDSGRRQMLQIHEDSLFTELRKLKEWFE